MKFIRFTFLALGLAAISFSYQKAPKIITYGLIDFYPTDNPRVWTYLAVDLNVVDSLDGEYSCEVSSGSSCHFTFKTTSNMTFTRSGKYKEQLELVIDTSKIQLSSQNTRFAYTIH